MSTPAKFLAYLIGLAVIAVVVGWIMGGETKKNSTRISIEAAPADVFGYLVESDQIRKWAAGVESVGSFSDDAEPQERIVAEGGKQTAWEDKVIRFQEAQMLSIQSKRHGMIRTLVFQLDINELGGTNVDYRVTESAAGLERFLFALKPKLKRTSMVDEMNRLRDLVESEVDFEPSERSSDDPSSGGSPVVASSASGDNAAVDEADGSSAKTSSSVVPVGATTGDEPNGDKRMYESLFRTGR